MDEAFTPSELFSVWTYFGHWPASLRYPLTIRRQFDILQFGPGWRGTECNPTN
jgi:hypothetical protein